MKSQMSKHWGGKGYNSPFTQLNSDTKLKDLPGKVVEAGKRVVDRVQNATIRDAVNVMAPGVGGILDKVNLKEKKEGKPYKDNSRPFSVIQPVQGVGQFPPPASNKLSATKTKLRPKAKSAVSKDLKSAGVNKTPKIQEPSDDEKLKVSFND